MDSYRLQMRAPNHPLPVGDSRTPVAWRQREQNFLSAHQQLAPPPQQQQQQRPASPTSTETDGSSSEVETSVSGRRYNRLLPPVYAAARTNTIRSTRSVPALNMVNTLDGEPCPVHGGTLMLHGHHHHHHFPPAAHPAPAASFHPAPPTFQTMRRAGSMFDVRVAPAGYYPPPVAYSGHPMPGPLAPQPLSARTLDRKSHYGSIRSIHSMAAAAQMGGMPLPPPPYNLPPMPPSHLLPPGMRPRPLVIPASVEPLPVRDPAKAKSGNGLPTQASVVGSKAAMDAGGEGYGKKKKSCHCCRGPLPLVWFIISIVTLGVVLGVVLGSIYG